MTVKKQVSSHQRELKGLPTDLLKTLDPEHNASYEQAWRNATFVTDPIKQAVLKRLESIELDTPADYDSPSWAAKRADKNGQAIALKYILKLLP